MKKKLFFCAFLLLALVQLQAESLLINVEGKASDVKRVQSLFATYAKQARHTIVKSNAEFILDVVVTSSYDRLYKTNYYVMATVVHTPAKEANTYFYRGTILQSGGQKNLKQLVRNTMRSFDSIK